MVNGQISNCESQTRGSRLDAPRPLCSDGKYFDDLKNFFGSDCNPLTFVNHLVKLYG